MNVTEIARRVRNTFGDTAGVLITDQMLYDWINDASRDIALKNGLLQTKATAVTVVGQAGYGVPAELLTLHSVFYNGEKLTPYSQTKADEIGLTNPNNATGIPQSFVMYADILTLYPTPSAVDDLLMVFTRRPVEVDSLLDVPEIAVQYHNRIVEYCLAQAAELDDNDAKASRKMQQFSQGVDEMRENADGDTEDFYPHFGVPLADTTFGYREDYY